MADDITDMLKEVGILTKLVKSLKKSNEGIKEIKSGDDTKVKTSKKSKLESEFKRDKGTIVSGFSTTAIAQLKLISPASGDGKNAPIKSNQNYCLTNVPFAPSALLLFPWTLKDQK